MTGSPARRDRDEGPIYGLIDDDCLDRHGIDDFDPAQATGILKIHRDCTPACPRAIAAMAVLKRIASRDG